MTNEAKDGKTGKSKGKKNERSVAKRIITLVSQEAVTLFHDENDKAYARVPIENHFETWPVQSEHFKDWLARLLWQRDKRPAPTDAINSALSLLRAQARFDGGLYSLWNRVARYDGAIWYDLADPEWKVVRVSPGSWEVVERPPILFRRYAHQQAQVPASESGSSLTDLLRFLNLRDRQQGMLLLVWLVSCLIPDMPHPLLALHGPKGSAKSTDLRMLRRLLDPSSAELLSPNADGKELVQQFSHHWAPFLDNVTRLPHWLSDALCRAVTGEGFSKRKLHSDDDDVIYTYKRCIGITSINIVASQPDLLDRSLLVELERIGDHYRPEEEIWAEFEDARPGLVSAMFTTLARAMAIRDSVRLSQSFRMADFAMWGSAIAVALGWTQEAFLAAYRHNEVLRNIEVLESSPVARAVMALMEGRESWEGEPTQLLADLEDVAANAGVSIDDKGWPGAPHVLTRWLNKISPDLEAVGIRFQSKQERKRRWIRLWKEMGNAEVGSDDANDGSRQVASPIASPLSPYAGGDSSTGYATDAIFPTVRGKEKEREYVVPGNSRENSVDSVSTVSPKLTSPDSSGCNTGDGDATEGNSVDPSQVAPPLSQTPFARRNLYLGVDDWPDYHRDLHEERAAIVEFESGSTRPCADIWAELMVQDIFEREHNNGNGGD